MFNCSSSYNRRYGTLLGIGWSLPHEVQLTAERDALGGLHALHYCDDPVRSMAFPPVSAGESHFNMAEGYYMICTELGQYVVQDIDGIYRDFGVPPAGFAGVLKMERLEDRNGNWQAFRYDADGLLVHVNDGCGRRLYIVYDLDHPQRVTGGKFAATLVQYRYTERGELAASWQR